MKKISWVGTVLVSLMILTCSVYAALQPGTAPVTGFAQSFLWNLPITNATITILETGQQIKTNEEGRFGPILYPVGKPLTLELKKFGYKTTQSATFIVPPVGLLGPYKNVTLQVPTLETFYLMAAIVGAKMDDQSCHVATTLAAFHKTLNDIPQGEVNAKLMLLPQNKEAVFYFDIFKNGPLRGMTNPFTKDLAQTSEDGGAAFFNLPSRNELYTLSAIKSGVKFNQAKFLCRKGAFINISPPALHAIS